MTDEELIAIVERADREMTPGEWVVYGSDRYCKEMPVEAVISSGENERGTALGRIVVWPGRDAFGDEEAAGIVALRNNAGAIVQALRRLTQERDAARAKLNDCHGLADIMSRIEQDRDNISVALAAERERREKAERERDTFSKAYQHVDECLNKAKSERDALRERCADLEAKLLK